MSVSSRGSKGFTGLKEKRDELIKIGTPETYFKKAGKVMDKWNQALLEEADGAHEERLLQQKYQCVIVKGKRLIS